MTTAIRSDLGWFFCFWLVVANGLWLATPWMDQWTAWMGPAWIWCIAIPGSILTALFPARATVLVLTLTCLPLVAMARATRRWRRWRGTRQSGRRYLPQF